MNLICLLFPAAVLFAQGMGGSAKAVPRASAKAKSELATPPIDFRDIAAAAGLTRPTIYGGKDRKRHILEMTGNGAVIFDYDNDGWRDIFVASGTRLETREQSTGRLYRNKGDGTFADITVQAGLTRTGWGQGACAGDIDNDGHTDLLATYYGANVLYRNRAGKFVEVPLLATGERWATGCALLDYDRDGLLDLFLSNYVRFDLRQAMAPGSSPFCNWRGLAVFCGPKGFPSNPNILYHNEGSGRFRDVSQAAGVVLNGLHYGLGVVSSDFDDDGWPDIYVACDSTPSILYRNNRDGTFTDIAVPAGVAYGDSGQEQGGMGAAAGDYDNDGWIDIVKTNFIDETPALYRNEGDRFFSDVTYAAGLGIQTKFVGWGVEFLDVDHDGWKDILMANGHIYPELSAVDTGERFQQPLLLYWNLRNGAFRDVTAQSGPAVSRPGVYRGMASGDLNGDGSIETVVVHMNEPPVLLRNTAARGNSILVELIGVKSNRSAAGARVTVHAAGHRLTDEVRAGSSYASQSDLRLSFGLGSAAEAGRIEIRWPSGLTETLPTAPANHWLTIREGEGIIRATPYRSTRR